MVGDPGLVLHTKIYRYRCMYVCSLHTEQGKMHCGVLLEKGGMVFVVLWIEDDAVECGLN